MTRLAASSLVVACLFAIAACATQPPAEEARALVAHEPLAVVAAPSTDPAASAVPAPAARIDDHRVFGDRIEVGNLTVWPLLEDAPSAGGVELGEFAELTDAQRRGDAGVWECGGRVAGLSFAQRYREQMAVRARADRGGAAVGTRASVSGVVIDNGGRIPLFVPAGTLVRGGLQDRILAEDLVVPPDTAVIARDYCVEPDRWNPMRAGRDTAGRFEAVEFMAAAEVRVAGQYAQSQRDVWRRVADADRDGADATPGVASPGERVRGDTVGSLVDHVEQVPSDVRRDRDAAVNVILRGFDALGADGSRVVGFAYAVNGRAVAVRAFADPRILRSRIAAFVRGIAAEAAMARRQEGVAARPARVEDAVALVRSVEASTDVTVTDRGTHRVRVVRSQEAWSSACRITLGGREVTLSEDWTAR